MERLVDWFLAHQEEPMLQFGMGIILGLLLAFGISLVIKGYKEDKAKVEEKDDDGNEHEIL